MSTLETKPPFLERFDSVWSRMRRAQMGQAACWGVLLAAAGFAALAAVDYGFEVARGDRAIGLAVVAGLSLALALTSFVRARRRWSRPRTAAEIESRFPELGQAVRTSVEFASRPASAIEADGVRASLVSALADSTEHKAAPLRIDSIVPAGRLRLAAGLAAAAVLVVLAAVAVDWEWRVAARRALLGQQAYTQMTVRPGNVTIQQGDDVALAIDLSGRTERTVIVAARRAGSDEPWVERTLAGDHAVSTQPRRAQYKTVFANLEDPIEYRVTAGPVHSAIYRIGVRHPLAIAGIRADVAPPEYTGIAPSVVEDGNLSVIDGSVVGLVITLDRAPASASIVITERGTAGPGESPHVEVREMAIDGSRLSAALQPRCDQTYTVVAEAGDGMTLPENKFRIRVRYDQPPEVWFEEPDEALEVHSIAEVLLRVRARDDFGLGRAGIVFEVNNEEEYTLLAKDYREIAELLAPGGESTRQTRDALQRLLPLELFNLEEKDSVTYYAFAEDAFPGGAHYTETDLRFIDIRPFRRIYRLPDPNAEGGGIDNFPVVRSLQEIIARQRFNLNRTIRLDRKAASGGKPALVEVDRIATFEDDLSKSTHELAEFLDEREFDGSDLLFQAEAVMLTSVDSLNVGKYDLSAGQQKDALRLLIEGRDTIENFLRSTADAAQRNALQSFDRRQIQRLRRPATDPEDEEDPERLVQRLRRLADEQDFIYKTLTTPLGGSAQTSVAEPMESPAESAPPAPDPAPAGDGSPPGPMPQTPEAGENPPGEADAAGTESREAPQGGGSDLSQAEIEQRQQDIAIEARDVERILGRIRNMSELARRRATAVADTADGVSGALGRGNTDEAAEAARRTAEMLRELALNVEGVLAAEPSLKIGMSRDLAGMIAALERRLAADQEPGPAGRDADRRRAELARRANRLADTGMTVEDVLDSVVETNAPGDRDVALRVDDLLGTGELRETVERMAGIAELVDTRRATDARVESEDVADRMEVLSRELDQLYRSIVTPRVERLLALEGRAVGLRESLRKLETNQQISTWHREALELLDDLEKADAARGTIDELYEAMQAEGWSKMKDRTRWTWPVGDQGHYLPPDRYGAAMSAIIDELQRQMQELILTDLASDESEPTPPKYKHLVERYIEVLSSDLRDQISPDR